MKKIVILTGLVLGFFILAGPAVQFSAAAEVSEVWEPAYDDGSNFEDVTAEMDSEAETRAPEAPPEDEAPGLAGIAID
jgi:hypothetical protein